MSTRLTLNNPASSEGPLILETSESWKVNASRARDAAKLAHASFGGDHDIAVTAVINDDNDNDNDNNSSSTGAVAAPTVIISDHHKHHHHKHQQHHRHSGPAGTHIEKHSKPKGLEEDHGLATVDKLTITPKQAINSESTPQSPAGALSKTPRKKHSHL
jgi:hypothetical protein